MFYERQIIDDDDISDRDLYDDWESYFSDLIMDDEDNSKIDYIEEVLSDFPDIVKKRKERLERRMGRKK